MKSPLSYIHFLLSRGTSNPSASTGNSFLFFLSLLYFILWCEVSRRCFFFSLFFRSRWSTLVKRPIKEDPQFVRKSSLAAGNWGRWLELLILTPLIYHFPNLLSASLLPFILHFVLGDLHSTRQSWVYILGNIKCYQAEVSRGGWLMRLAYWTNEWTNSWCYPWFPQVFIPSFVNPTSRDEDSEIWKFNQASKVS